MGAGKPKRCDAQCWAFLSNALYSVTHPSCTSNEGPTACILSRYVDVVPVVQWFVLPESYGRPPVEVVNSTLDNVSLSTNCKGNGFVSVCDRMRCNNKTLKVPLCSLGNTRPG